MKLNTFLAGLASLTFTMVGCSKKEVAEETKLRLLPIEVLELKQAGGYPVEERFVGKIEARRKSRLAFEVGGTVEQVYFDEGDEVREGDLLAHIDTARLEARRAELEATLAQAEATLENSESTLKRFENLIASNAVSQQELDNSREQNRVASATVRRIKALIESVDVDLGKSELKAPYSGTLAARGVDEGAVVSQNEMIFELLESTDLQIRTAVSPKLADQVVEGAEVSIALPSGEGVDLKVERILPRIDPATRTVDVILTVEEGPESLRDGDLVDLLRARVIPESGFFLPRDALTESHRGLWACFIAVPDVEAGSDVYRLDRRDLEILHTYADAVFVRGALHEGDWVMSAGLHKIAPGQRVKVERVDRERSFEEIVYH